MTIVIPNISEQLRRNSVALMNLLPPPVPTVGEALYSTWLQHFNTLEEIDGNGRHTKTAQQAEEALRNVLSDSREAVINTLQSLD